MPIKLQRGIIIGYKLEVKNSSNTVVYVTSTVIRNLQMFIKYELRVLAFTRKGDGPWSVVIPLRTKNRGTALILYVVSKFSLRELRSLTNDDGYCYENATKQEYHWLKEEK